MIERPARPDVKRELARGLARWRARRWQVAQCAVAAAVAWLFSVHVLGHPSPVFAAIAAVVALGTSYGQRLRRVAEVTLGVALGVLLGDVMLALFGSTPVAIMAIVGVAMSLAIVINGGQMFVNQAAVQGIFVVALGASAGTAWTRWIDALVGGAVALVAATIVPAAPLRRPREQAAVVVRKTADLLTAAAEVMREADAVHGMAVLADARSTDPLVRELQAAADEGMSVVASSPFRVRHRTHVRAMSDLVEPLDRALRSTRVLVRQVAVAAYRGQIIPESYAEMADRLSDMARRIAAELAANRSPESLQPSVIALADLSADLGRTDSLNAEGVLLQLRAIIADLLQITGMGQFEATDALPMLRD